MTKQISGIFYLCRLPLMDNSELPFGSKKTMQGLLGSQRAPPVSAVLAPFLSQVFALLIPSECILPRVPSQHRWYLNLLVKTGSKIGLGD